MCESRVWYGHQLFSFQNFWRTISTERFENSAGVCMNAHLVELVESAREGWHATRREEAKAFSHAVLGKHAQATSG